MISFVTPPMGTFDEPNEIIEWTIGKKTRIPDDARIIDLREFILQDQGD